MADPVTPIAENVQGPLRVQTDAGTTEMYSLKDQIEADKYLTGKEAVKNPARGLRITQLIPPGTS